MIKGIKTENFRCFKKLNAANLGWVNLLGGQNNSGKTAFLEALYLAVAPNSATVRTLFFLREPDLRIALNELNQIWNNLFYERDTTNEISFKLLLSWEESEIDISLKVLRSDQFIQFKSIGNTISEERLEMLLNNDKSDLQIQAIRPNGPKTTSVLKVQDGKIVVDGVDGVIHMFADFHPSTARVPSRHLAKLYSNSALDGKSDLMLEAFRLFDSSIEDIRIFDVAGPSIYLTRKHRKSMPLSMFGDAMNKIAQYTLGILGSPGSVLLIDEIENGIHHSNHERVWRFLFDLSKKFEVQIFATSHSGEMIEAFTKVASQDTYNPDCRYFELTRDERSPDIVLNYIPIPALESKIEGNRPYRGEI